MSAVLDLFRLDGKVAVVTGASSGLGVSFAGALADAGADVALAGPPRRETRRHQEDGGKQGQAGDHRRLRRLRSRRVRGRRGRRHRELRPPDILVNNAGIADSAPATREAPEEFDRVIQTNLNGTPHGPGMCAGHEERRFDRQYRQHPGPDVGADAAGRVQRQQGRRHRTHPRPGTAVVGSQGHPRQRHRPRILCLRDDLRADRGGYMQTFVIPRTCSAGSATRANSTPRSSSWPPTPAATSPGSHCPSTGNAHQLSVRSASITPAPGLVACLLADHVRLRIVFHGPVRLLISAPVFASVITRVSEVVNPSNHCSACSRPRRAR